ncbi:MAG TPA: MGMT family protein [Spirochaetota bacterium]|nr:MGMT family protein [Spirochaetota bacterium]
MRDRADRKPSAQYGIVLGEINILVLTDDDAVLGVVLEPDDACRRKYEDIPSRKNEPISAVCAFFESYALRRTAPLPPLDLSPFSANERRVYETLLKTKAGETVTYGELAARAGFPGAARFAGMCMRKNHFPVIIPCHRVLPASGGIGNYTPDPRIKKLLLDFESGSAGITGGLFRR